MYPKLYFFSENARGLAESLRTLCSVIAAAVYYGPSLMPLFRDGFSKEALVRDIVAGWKRDSFELLPRRYRMLLQELLDHGIISDDAFDKYMFASKSVLVSEAKDYALRDPKAAFVTEGFPFPWDEDAEMLFYADDALTEKVRLFEKEYKRLCASRRGFYYFISILHPM